MLLEKGELSPGAARAIVSLEGAALQIEAAKKIVEGRLSVREAEKLVKSMSQKPKSGRKSKASENDMYYQEAQRKLSGALSRKIKISDSGNRGRIEIEYYDLEDFERLYDALTELKLKGE